MKSKFVTVAMLATLSLAGCRTRTSSTPSVSKPVDPSTLKTEIVIGSPTKHQPFVKGKVEAWLKTNGYTNVTLKMYDLAESDAKSITDFTGAGAPDIYAYASDHTLDLMAKGALAEVPEEFATEMVKNMGQTDVDAAKVGDAYYAYPYAGDNGYYLYYNKDIVKRFDTVEHIIADCQAANVKFGYALETDSSFFSIGTMFTFGARYNVTIDNSGKISSVKADFDGAKGLKAAKAIRDLMKSSPTVVTTHQGARDVAPSGEASGFGAIVEGSWNYTNFRDGKKNEDGTFAYVGMGDKLGCAKLPTVTVDGETKNLGSFLGYKLYGVNPQKSSGNADRLALLHTVANFLVSDATQEGRWDELQVAPTSDKVAALTKVASDDHIKAINDQAKFSVGQTIVPNGIWAGMITLADSIKKNLSASDEQLTEFLKAFNNKVIGKDDN